MAEEESSRVKLACSMDFIMEISIKQSCAYNKQKIMMYMTIKYKDFPDDLTFVLLYMKKEEAVRFTKTYYQMIHENSLLKEWTKFTKVFEAQFYAKEMKRAALDCIINLKQTGGVDAYISIF